MKIKYLLISITILASTFACSDLQESEIKEQKNPTGSLASETRCSLVPDPGPCKAYFKKYYYDAKEDKCKEFIWGGCDGIVPFETLDECEKCKQN